MDEYTFLVLAKLKADRLRLEREAASALRLMLPQSEHAESRNTRSEYSRRTHTSAPTYEWSEQS